jgi:probable F420-dependent oxidoreductase
MRIGAVLPQTEIGDDPIAVRDCVQAVEGMGFDHVLVYDHVLGFTDSPSPSYVGPVTPELRFHEPFVLFGFLAALTTRIELATGVLVLPMRQTVLVAKQAAEVDALSGGRLRLGVGVGHVRREHDVLNEDFSTRGKRVEEQITVLRALWKDDAVTFTGRWHRIDGGGLSPRPVQRPIPIWLGGMSEAALERAARLADGWIPTLMTPDDRARAMVEQLRTLVAKAGRPSDSVGLDVHLPLRSVPPEQWATHTQGWRELGATHLSIETMKAGLTTPQAHIDALGRVKAALDV